MVATVGGVVGVVVIVCVYVSGVVVVVVVVVVVFVRTAEAMCVIIYCHTSLERRVDFML